jgi:hypothetical protein
VLYRDTIFVIYVVNYYGECQTKDCRLVLSFVVYPSSMYNNSSSVHNLLSTAPVSTRLGELTWLAGRAILSLKCLTCRWRSVALKAG